MTIGGSTNRDVNRDLERARELLKPLVTMFVDAGVTAIELQSVVEELYFEEIRDYYGDDGKPARVTTIALLGGMTRKKVSALLHGQAPRRRQSTLKRVAHRWRNNAPWSIDGTPLVLELEGRVSFTSLCRVVGGLHDTTPRAVAELAGRLGYLRAEGKNRYQLLEGPAKAKRADERITRHFIDVAVAANALVADRCVEQTGRNIIAPIDAAGLVAFILERLERIKESGALG